MMRFLMKFSGAVAIFAFLGGCAVGNTYDYQSTAMQLPVKGAGQELNVEVIDNRPYVLNGKKAPSFIGLQRGGYGNPFDVNTSSGRPLSEDFRVAISRALENSSYNITDSANKTVELTVREWKTDAMMKLRLIYDLTLSILTSDDEVVASVTDAGDEVLGGASFEGANSQNASSGFNRKISRLFNREEIRDALEE